MMSGRRFYASGFCSGMGVFAASVAVALALFLAPFYPPSALAAGDFNPLPDTGQTKCYNASGNEVNPCPSSGQDFYR